MIIQVLSREGIILAGVMHHWSPTGKSITFVDYLKLMHAINYS